MARCKYCNATATWDHVDDKWVLFDETGNRHRCKLPRPSYVRKQMSDADKDVLALHPDLIEHLVPRELQYKITDFYRRNHLRYQRSAKTQ